MALLLAGFVAYRAREPSLRCDATRAQTASYTAIDGGTLTSEQIRQIVTYLRSLDAKAPSIPSWRTSASARGESSPPRLSSLVVPGPLALPIRPGGDDDPRVRPREEGVRNGSLRRHVRFDRVARDMGWEPALPTVRLAGPASCHLGVDQARWFCPSCEHCWRVEHGRLRPVNPITCHGCAAKRRDDCIRLLQGEFPRFGAGAAGLDELIDA